MEGPPYRRTKSKAPAPEVSFDSHVISVWKWEGARKSARLRDRACLNEAKREVSHAPATGEIHYEKNPAVTIPVVPLSEIVSEPATYTRLYRSNTEMYG